MLSPVEFNKSFTRLIILTWLVPPMIGFSFIIFIEILTVDQLVAILLSPTESVFSIAWLVIAVLVLRRVVKPISAFVEAPGMESGEAALRCMRRFPLKYWSLFIAYLMTAPASVILSAEYLTDYVAQPVDWFRLHLIALIVSIIVGLPIFFKLLDLFGEVLDGLDIKRAHITVKMKVFLIGALVPLLIDTMIVQYYWTRTGYFTTETFFVWLMLEVIAIGGSLIFAHSFSQSLSPFQQLTEHEINDDVISQHRLEPRSTDEIGVLVCRFHDVLDELYRYKDHLEELVDERTEELQRVNRELESFSYSVSHDLRAPLRAIDGFSQALLEDYAGSFDDDGRDYIMRVRGATSKMSNLIDDMLELSRISRTEMNMETIDLTTLAKELTETFHSHEPDRVIEVVIEEGLSCVADRKLITVVLRNLVDNAFKYTGRNDKAVISIGRQEGAKKDIFFVKDNGAGFDMEFSDKLFGAFQRLHSESEFKGTGVGLATVQRVINRHGGEVWAKSAVGEGATFYFTI